MFGTEFSHELIRKYVVLFGTLFNNVTISRYDNADVKVQNFKVPIEYGPREKYIGMTEAKPDGKKQAVMLPRMSFEITGFSYNSGAQLDRANRHFNIANNSTFELSPWIINFQVNIMVKNNIDGTRIVEQILPYFDPSYSITAELIDGIAPFDLSIDMTDISHEDLYNSTFEERRAVTWTLNFAMYAFFAKPVKAGKQIKMVITRLHPSMTESGGIQIVNQPGLTSNGQPTSNLSTTIPYTDIDQDDNFGYIVTISDI